MEALGNHIFVSLQENTMDTIYIPPIFKEKNAPCFTGVVRYAAQGAIVKPGDIVAFNKWSGDELMYRGERLLLISPGTIFAVK